MKMGNSAAAKTVEVFGLRVFSDELGKIPLQHPCSTLSTISPNSYGISTKDPVFDRALKAADYLVLDGVYFALSSILLQRRSIKPNQGPDVFYFFIKKLDEIKGRAFFLGASDDTLRKIKERAALDYPNVTIESYSPPYKPEFDEVDNALMVEKINAARPDIVFLGMTAPKQEKWAYLHSDKLNAKLAISIGGVFDWYAGNEKAVAPIWWKLKLVWLVRTIQRPEILKRYPNIFIFFWHLLLAVLGIKRFPHA